MKTSWLDYQSSLSAFLRSRVGNPDDAEDLLQEILIKIHSNLQTVKDNSKVKPWIFQIANNTIIDFYRQRNKEHKLNVDDLWYEQQEAHVVKELARCILPIMQHLPEKDAALLMAIEIEAVPQKTYAKRNNINYSTLKSRVKKSRQKLFKLFSDCCEFSIDSQGSVLDYKQKSKSCSRC